MKALRQCVGKCWSAMWFGKLCAPLVILVLFYSTLTGESQLAFRDVGHFYTPLYDYVAERCAQDTLPLWNPLDQTGIPLLGETTTAVLYPIRYVVFALPISTGTAMAWYVVLHLWIASITAWTAARWCGVSHASAALASVAYPLSGSVLFLYTNPPFLVAAAWMPLVIGACLSHRKFQLSKRFLVIAISLSMMVLGGDPQTGLHTVLLSSVFLLSNRIFAKNRDATKTLATLAGACAFAALLSLPQLAASYSWTRQSYRAINDEPKSLWTPPTTGSQQYDAFSYSLPPWHLAELCLPRAFGDLFPIYRRWSVMLPGDGRVWTPSIYVGLFAFLATVSMLLSRRLDRWMAVAAFSALCSMGHFGCVWILSQFTSRLDDVDSAAGGAYWFLHHFVPGYDAFRYPAKWLPFLSLAIAIIASKFLDRTKCPRFEFPRRQLVVLASGFVVVAVSSYWFQDHWQPPNRLPRDRFWGPLELSGFGVYLALLMLGAIAFVMRHRPAPHRKHFYVWAIVAITAIDLAYNDRHLIATVNQSQVAKASTDPGSTASTNRWMRLSSGGGFPKSWRDSSSANRMLEVEATQRATWFGRWHLERREAVFNNMLSIRSNASTRFWQATNTWSKQATLKDQAKLWSELRVWLAIDGVIKTNNDAISINGLQIGKPQYVIDPANASSVKLHSTWNQRPAGQATKKQMLELLDERFRLGASAVVTVYGDSVDSSSNQVRTGELTDESYFDFIHTDSESAEIRVASSQPLLLTRAILQDGHWNATLRSRDGDIQHQVAVVNVDHLTQGVFVPAGDWTVTFAYRPTWLTATLAVSAIAWMIWLYLAVRGPAATVWSRVRPVR